MVTSSIRIIFLAVSAFEDSWMTKAITNITRDKDGFYIRVQVPGFERDEIHVEFDDNTIKIVAEKEPEEGHEIIHEEISCHKMVRSSRSCLIMLTSNDITAKLDKGILTIFLPVEEQDSVHKEIAVQ